MKKKIKKFIRKNTIFLGLAAVIIVYLIVSGAGTYIFRWNNILTRISCKIFPFPSAVIGGSFVTIGELEERLLASKNFYASQNFSDLGLRIDFSTSDGEKRLLIKEKYILTKMIEDKIIEKEIKKAGIEIAPEMVSREMEKKMEEYGTKENVIAEMKHLYGWTMEDFKEKIVRPDILKSKLYERLRENDQEFQEARKKIAEAQKELEKGRDFEEVVGRYSEGESAKNRGDLGWFRMEEILPEIALAAFDLPKGKKSEILESRLGYHIVAADDKKTEEGIEKIRIRQIFVKTPTFSDWLLETEKKYKIYVPYADYFWDQKNGRVEFTNKELREFEENIQKNSPDDISVLF